MALDKTGDASNRASVASIPCALPFPVVAKAALQDQANPINDQSLSGKKRGACVLADDGTNLTLTVALGSSPTSVWVLASEPTNVVFVTPA